MTNTEPNQSSEQTPQKPRAMSSGHLNNIGSSDAERAKRNKRESPSLARKIIHEPEVLSLACPIALTNQRAATTAKNRVLQLLEALRPQSEQGIHSLTPLLRQLPADVLNKLRNLAKGLGPWINSDASVLTREDVAYRCFKDLVLFVMRCLKALPAANAPRNHYRLLLPYTGPNDFKPRDSNEPFFLDQALFIRRWDDQRGDEIDKGVSEPYYVDMLAAVEAKKSESKSAIAKASGGTNSKSGGSSSRRGNTRSGGGSNRRGNSANNQADLASSGAHNRPGLGKAQEQLVRYNRQLYEHQHNRIFTWGLSVCGTLLQVHHFGPDCILSSGDLDMRTLGDRSKFIEWLVNLCLGEDVRRGFLPSMQLMDSTAHGLGKRWEISIPSVDSAGATEDKVLHAREPTVVAGSTFGRHTRGFPASTTMANILPHGEPDMFVKVAWQYADRGPEPRRKSEIDHLRAINDKHASGDWPDVRIPKLVAAETAKISNGSKEMVDLTTDVIYGEHIVAKHGVIDRLPNTADADDNQRATRSRQPPPFNPFKRFDDSTPDIGFTPERQIAFRRLNIMATQPHYKPLNSVRSADELIIVLADAMRTHDWMMVENDLLHRDISPNNIMVGYDKAQGDSSSVYGQLIDLDYAINPSDERHSRPERTGTLPFMSILNLEGHPDQRTELDDWESLIYVLCWVATFGINADDAEKLNRLHTAPGSPELVIGKWQDGRSMGDIATDKRVSVDTVGVFHKRISMYFSGPELPKLMNYSEEIYGELPDYKMLQVLALKLYVALFQNSGFGPACHGAGISSSLESILEGIELTTQASGKKTPSADPFVERAKDPVKRTIVASLLKVMDDSADLARKRIAAAAAAAL